MTVIENWKSISFFSFITTMMMMIIVNINISFYIAIVNRGSQIVTGIGPGSDRWLRFTWETFHLGSIHLNWALVLEKSAFIRIERHLAARIDCVCRLLHWHRPPLGLDDKNQFEYLEIDRWQSRFRFPVVPPSSSSSSSSSPSSSASSDQLVVSSIPFNRWCPPPHPSFIIAVCFTDSINKKPGPKGEEKKKKKEEEEEEEEEELGLR